MTACKNRQTPTSLRVSDRSAKVKNGKHLVSNGEPRRFHLVCSIIVSPIKSRAVGLPRDSPSVAVILPFFTNTCNNILEEFQPKVLKRQKTLLKSYFVIFLPQSSPDVA